MARYSSLDYLLYLSILFITQNTTIYKTNHLISIYKYEHSLFILCKM